MKEIVDYRGFQSIRFPVIINNNKELNIWKIKYM